MNISIIQCMLPVWAHAILIKKKIPLSGQWFPFAKVAPLADLAMAWNRHDAGGLNLEPYIVNFETKLMPPDTIRYRAMRSRTNRTEPSQTQTKQMCYGYWFITPSTVAFQFNIH